MEHILVKINLHLTMKLIQNVGKNDIMVMKVPFVHKLLAMRPLIKPV